MKVIYILRLAFTAIAILLCGCGGASNSSKSESVTPILTTGNTQTTTSHNLIPVPKEFLQTGELFNLTNETTIAKSVGDTNYLTAKNDLVSFLTISTGIILTETEETADIELSIDSEIYQDEEYELLVTDETIRIIAGSDKGLFYGIQTLKQLVVSSDNFTGDPQDNITVGGVQIKDKPRYEYRGAMLDVARHFFSVTDVKKYIDHLAYYKLNRLHLHLTDDQGWRIEIKSWPNLTEYGGKLEVGGTKGGYYTQEDYSELVTYAASKHITIVPEIDMPGHTNAALASYPELNCNNEAPELYTGIEVGFSSLCIDKNITYQFVEDVIRELSALTPEPFFHIGGDESLVTSKKDYISFVETIQQTVQSYGKTLVGWEEIAQSKLIDGSYIQLWKESDYIEDSTTESFSVIMSPAGFTYLDMKYNSTTTLGLNWAGYVDVEKAYKWEPTDSIKDSLAQNIVGVEAPLWTETITNIEELEYMAFPRLLGHAETAWSTGQNKDWNQYRHRLAAQQTYFNLTDTNFYRSELIPWSN